MVPYVNKEPTGCSRDPRKRRNIGVRSFYETWNKQKTTKKKKTTHTDDILSGFWRDP